MQRATVRMLLCLCMSTWMAGCAHPIMGWSAFDPGSVVVAPDKAVVYFMRLQKPGWVNNASVFDGEQLVGIVPYKTKLPYLAAPGEHIFMVVGESADFIKAELLAGKTYYVEVTPRTGWGATRFSLDPVSKHELGKRSQRKKIGKCSLIRNTDSAYSWAEAHEAVIHKKHDSYLAKWNQKDESGRPFLRPEDGE